MLANRAADTSPEVALRRELHRRGLRFRKQVRPISGLRCTADIAFMRARVAVFVDGCFWHRCPIHATTPRANAEFWQTKFDLNVARDRRNDATLAAAGWSVVRIWEHEAPEAAARRVAKAVANARVDPHTGPECRADPRDPLWPSVESVGRRKFSHGGLRRREDLRRGDMSKRGGKPQGPSAGRQAVQQRLDRFREQRSALEGKRTPPVRPSSPAIRHGTTRQRRG
jgi:DNA mismatch endonuclease (patch repair protein)